MIIGTTSIPDWFAHGIQRSTLATSFSVLQGILQGIVFTIYCKTKQNLFDELLIELIKSSIL